VYRITSAGVRLIAFAAVGLLIAGSAGAGGQERSNTAPSCDNDGHCTTSSATPSSSMKTPIFPAHRKSESHPDRVRDANGNSAVVSVETAYGFKITVHPAYASKFLKLFSLLKDHGYNVPGNITKCWSPRGTRVAGSNHYIGAACDIQTGWNRGPDFVYHISNIIKQAGLYDGCSFRDCGHIEAVRGTHNKAPPLYAAIEKFKTEQSTANYQP
jgi:hypothetical protein